MESNCTQTKSPFLAEKSFPQPSPCGLLTLINASKRSASLLFFILTLIFSINNNAKAANLVISSASEFSTLDGSASDDDGSKNGILTVNGNLTITGTGSITANDPASPLNNSAGNIIIHVSGDLNIQSGGAIYAENHIGGGSGGSIDITVGGNLVVFGGGIISSARTTTSGSGNGGPITITTGGNIDLQANSIVSAADLGGGVAGNIKLIAGGTANIDGIVSSGPNNNVQSTYLTGFVFAIGNTTQRGGKILIVANASCTSGAGVTISTTGIVASQGDDPASDSVIVQGCGIVVNGLVASVAKKTNGSPGNRPVVKLLSGTSIVINSQNLGGVGPNQGRVRADYVIGEAPLAYSVNLYAKGDIIINGPASGIIFSVSSNGGTSTNMPGGTVNATSTEGGITGSGLAIQANGGASGSMGGKINLLSTLNVNLSGGKLEAKGSTTGGNPDGGDVLIRSYSQNIVSNAASSINVTGGYPTPEGTVVLTACGTIGFPPGTVIPVAPTKNLGVCSPATASLPNGISLPDCGVAPCSIGDLVPSTLICNSGNYTISTSLSPALFNFVWSITVDGNPPGWAIIGSNTGQSITFSSGDCGAPGFLVHITLTVTDKASACTATCSKDFAPGVPACNVSIRPPITLTCLVTSQYLLASYSTDIVNPTFDWTRNGVSIGPGINDGNGLDSILISSAGTYRFTVHDPANSTNDCFAEVTVIENKTSPPCSIGDVSPTSLICNHGNYTIGTSLSPALFTFSWSISVDGNPPGWAIIGSNTGQSITFSSGNCGSFGFLVHITLTVTDKANGCTSTCSKDLAPGAPACNVSIRPPVPLNCIVTSQYLLASYSTDIINPTFDWTRNGVSIGPGINDGISLDSILISSEGTYRFTVHDPANSANDCFDEVTVVRNNDAPPANCGARVVLTCLTTSHSITVNNCDGVPNRSYSWVGPGGFTSSLQCPNVSATGTYTVTVTNTLNGCTNTCTVPVDLCISTPKIVCPKDKSITTGNDKGGVCVDKGGGGRATAGKINSTGPKSAVGIDFRQPRNENHPADPLYWTNGINNQTQSEFFEGMGNPQRIIFTGIAATGGNKHTLLFRHEAVKHQDNDRHAYDFMMSWEQAILTAADIGNGATNELQNLLAQTCNDGISATALAACNSFTTSAKTDLPDAMGNPPNHHGIANVDDNIDCFEDIYGNRQIEIKGKSAITNFKIVFEGYDGTATGDNYAWYTISWTSASPDIMIKLAGRAAMGEGTCGYGTCFGAGSIHGGPYHFKLDLLDGYAIGNRDNQLMVGKSCVMDIPITFEPPVASDSCIPSPAPTPVPVGPDNVFIDSLGNKVTCRTWRATNACGLFAECTQCITVICIPGKRMGDPDDMTGMNGENVSINVYPNPFTDKTIIELMPNVGYAHTTLDLFDVGGRKVTTLYTGGVEAGQTYQFTINGSALPTGVYFYSFKGGDEVIVGKVVLIK